MIRRRTLPVVGALLLVTGCAGTGFNNTTFQHDVLVGRYDAALKQLDAFSEKDVSSLLDRGLVLQALGRYEESNAAFQTAEELIDDLYTRSLSKEVLSLLTSDRALDYRASGFEHAYIAYYRAWNYLQLDQPDEVLVEARAIGERLTFRSASCEDEGGACGHDVFLRYFSGLLFEWGGETNDAFIAYKQADEAADTFAERFGVAPPGDLGRRLVGLARRLGFQDDAAHFAAKYGVEEVPEPGSGSVVVLWENGAIGTREQVNALIPIMKGESTQIAGDRDRWSRKLAGRRHQHYEKAELEYLLRISLPEFREHPPVGRQAEFRLARQEVSSRVVSPLSAMAAASLDQAMGGILVRSISRALVKYLASRTADKEIGSGAGLVLSLLGAGLENADTRSWRSLPYEIQVADLEVPPGTYEGSLTIRGPNGAVLETVPYADIQVPRNGIAFLRHRSGP